jgi:uncharacterized protein YdhG (YjbR/CyaY superfamily)
VQSTAVTVDEYLREVPEERRACLDALRRACREHLVGFDEAMAYGMPSYARDGEVAVAFASQKQHIALYMMRKDVLAAHRDRLAGLNVGKGCIRYRRPAQVDLAVVESMLEQTAATAGPVC